MNSNQKLLLKCKRIHGNHWLGGIFNPLWQPYATENQQSDEWKKTRNKYPVNCSNIAAAIGIGFTSRQVLYKEKVLGIKPKIDSIVQRWFDYGNEHEIDGIKEYIRFMGKSKGTVMRCGCFIDVADNFSGSPDGIWIDNNTCETILLEVKVPNPDHGSIPDAIPEHYITQVMGMMKILRLEKTHFIYWTPTRVVIYELFFVPEVWDYMYRHMTTFMDFCMKGVEPTRMKAGGKDEIKRFIRENSRQTKLFDSNPNE